MVLPLKGEACDGAIGRQGVPMKLQAASGNAEAELHDEAPCQAEMEKPLPESPQ